jgi:hypothetical protein
MVHEFLNQNWKSYGNWGAILVSLESLQWVEFYRGDSIMFRP